MKKRDLVTMIEAVEQTVGMLRREVDGLVQLARAMRSEVDGLDGKNRTMTEDVSGFVSGFGHRISMLESEAAKPGIPWWPVTSGGTFPATMPYVCAVCGVANCVQLHVISATNGEPGQAVIK